MIPQKRPVHPVLSDEEDQLSPFIEVAEAVKPVAPAGPPAEVQVPVHPNEARAVVPVESVEPVELPALCRSARAGRGPEYILKVMLLKHYASCTL